MDKKIADEIGAALDVALEHMGREYGSSFVPMERMVEVVLAGVLAAGPWTRAQVLEVFLLRALTQLGLSCGLPHRPLG